MSKFSKRFLARIKNEYSSMVEDAESAAEFAGFIDTGSYILNAVFSGSLYGGIPNNKLTAFAGESATGKTFFVLGICKTFLESDPEATVVFFDTEAAVTKKMMEDRGIDTSRVIVYDIDTVENFKFHSIKVLDEYTEEKNPPPMLIVLDSLGMMSTSKEIRDSTDGKETRDMTRAQGIKGTLRVLVLKAAKAKVPILITNHVYDTMDLFSAKKMSGGSGPLYACSSIAFLSKKKEKDGTEVIGNIIHVKMHKSRLSKENSTVDVRLTYKHGLDKYYGLLELAEKYNIIQKVSTRYELPDGTKVFGKEINSNPEKYFTEDIMARLEEAANKEFSYGDGK